MKNVHVFALGLLLLMSFSCKQGQQEKKGESERNSMAGEEMVKRTSDNTKTITFQLEPKSDSKVSGAVTFTEDEDGMVVMNVTLSGLSKGEHAIHLHEKADCSSADGVSAGGHWNPTFEPHGEWEAKTGYHKGDIGNFMADANGNATVHFSTNQWCIGCSDKTKNIIGKAVIVHQGADDFTSQPSGAAGKRIACVGIIQ